ncbi:MAG TPA: toprim domain-containing protein [Terracidiphilus sp.]|nr:toprim domain-containing protein [Terracidiphilus sp.]
MPYVPPEVKERLKREVSIQRLAEARGIKLTRSGKELIGLCPFHDDRNPSLNIDPVKNVWSCKGACGEGGDVFLWVMRAEGVSFHHALELLKRDYAPSAGPVVKIATVPKLPPLIDATADDKKLLGTVVDYYNRTLKDSPEAQRYLVKRGLESSEIIDRFKLGYANRSLCLHLPASNRAAGEAQRTRLKELGILRNQKPGHEHFNGSLVVPVFNLAGEVVEMYGRKITPNLRAGTPDHTYLPGPHRGVWNEEAFIASKEIILCEALIDALTFWVAGYRNVTASYGVNGFTADHRAAFERHGTERVYIAYDRDDAGDKAAAKLAEELMGMGIECFRVQFPKGQDANEYARVTQPAAKALGVLLTGAAWMGKGPRPAGRAPVPVVVAEPAAAAAPTVEPLPAEAKSTAKEKKIEEPMPEPTPEPTPTPGAAVAQVASEPGPEPEKPQERAFSLAVNAVPLPAVPIEEPAARPMPLSVPTEPQVKTEGGEVAVTIGPREYRVLGLDKCTSRGQMRVNVKVSGHNVRGEFCYHGDTLDMEAFRQRAAFVKQAAHELAAKEETIHREVGQLWTVLAELQRERIAKVLAPPEETALMTAEEQAAAMELLRDPRLLERVLEDFEKCGAVGEETNKKVSYLAAVSRMLAKPLAIVVQSSSSAGKSSLMEAVLDFMPEEHRESYTAMTGQALFYMGQKNLKHKILAIAEQQGAEAASYPLKLLQSEGKLNIASTGKDPVSGKHVTHEYTVEGPVMLFLTTTAHEVDEELMNRCLVLAVNEDREQTQAIHQKQREAQTLDGLKARRRRDKIVRLHRNAQRLLRPVDVVIECLKERRFPDTMTRTRRDHMKFIALIQAIALLNQHQREIKTSIDEDGETFEYIEATEADAKLAWELASHVLMRSLDDVPPQTRRLLLLIDKMVTAECERLQIERLDYRFTRATVRQFTGWGDSQLKKHLSRLEDLEYLALHRGVAGQSFVYALNFEMDENGRPVLPGLSYGAKSVRVEADRSRLEEGVSHFEAGVSPAGHGGVTGVSGGGHDAKSPAMTRVEDGFSVKSAKNAYMGAEASSAPQTPVVVVPVPRPNGRTGGSAWPA